MLMTYTKSQYEMPDGKYLAKFLGVSLREDKPGDKPRVGQDGKPMPPAMTWDFEIVEGEHAGKKTDKLTGRVPTPKNGCGKMLAAVTDAILTDGQQVDLSRYAGLLYRVTVLENRVQDSPAPVRVYDPKAPPANGFPNSPTINGANPGAVAPPAVDPPAPDAKWDYHDGKALVCGVSTEDVTTYLAANNLDPSALWVKPAGADRKDAKRAHEFGFKTPDVIPF